MNIIGAISTQSVKVAVGILGVVGAQTPVQTCLADCCVATDDSYSTEASPTSGENFGGAIALDGATAVIGAPRKEHGTDTDVGKAFVQTYSGGAWGSATPLTAFPQVEGDFFGNGVGISGDLVIVGAPYAASNDGRAFVFDGSNSWDRSTLTPPSGTTIFGYSVAIDGTVVVVGASVLRVVQELLSSSSSIREAGRKQPYSPQSLEITGISSGRRSLSTEMSLSWEQMASEDFRKARRMSLSKTDHGRMRMRMRF